MKKITILFLLFTLNLTYGQNGIRKYQTFTFDNYSPKWQHVVIDSSIVGDTLAIGNNYYIYDGWSHLTSSLPGNYLQESKGNIYFFRNNIKDNFEGGYIECLDKYTGDVNWDNSFDLRSNSNREYPFDIGINDNNDIEIIGFRRLDRDSLLSNLWIQSTFFRRMYNPISGHVNSYSYGKENDSLNQIINNPLSYNTNTLSSIIFPRNNHIQYISIASFGFINYISMYNNMLLSDKGYKVNESKYDIPYQYLPRFNSVSEIGEDSLLLIRYSTVFDLYNRKDSFNIVFDIVDRDLNVLKSKELSDLVNPCRNFKLLYSDDKTFIISGLDYGDSDSLDYIFLHFYLFDFEGKLLEQLTIKDNYKFGEFELESTKALTLRNENKMILISKGNRYFEDGYSSLNIYKSDGNGGVDTLKILKVISKKHKITPVKLYQLENDDILLECNDSNSNYPSSQGSYYSASVLICFDAKELGIKTSIVDYSTKKDNNITISPNPSNGIINIEFVNNLSGNIEIYNEVGKLVLRNNFIQKSNYKINISGLKIGMYFIKITDKTGKIKYKTVSFIKE